MTVSSTTPPTTEQVAKLLEIVNRYVAPGTTDALLIDTVLLGQNDPKLLQYALHQAWLYGPKLNSFNGLLFDRHLQVRSPRLQLRPYLHTDPLLAADLVRARSKHPLAPTLISNWDRFDNRFTGPSILSKGRRYKNTIALANTQLVAISAAFDRALKKLQADLKGNVAPTQALEDFVSTVHSIGPIIPSRLAGQKQVPTFITPMEYALYGEWLYAQFSVRKRDGLTTTIHNGPISQAVLAIERGLPQRTTLRMGPKVVSLQERSIPLEWQWIEGQLEAANDLLKKRSLAPSLLAETKPAPPARARVRAKLENIPPRAPERPEDLKRMEYLHRLATNIQLELSSIIRPNFQMERDQFEINYTRLLDKVTDLPSAIGVYNAFVRLENFFKAHGLIRLDSQVVTPETVSLPRINDALMTAPHWEGLLVDALVTKMTNWSLNYSSLTDQLPRVKTLLVRTPSAQNSRQPNVDLSVVIRYRAKGSLVSGVEDLGEEEIENLKVGIRYQLAEHYGVPIQNIPPIHLITQERVLTFPGQREAHHQAEVRAQSRARQMAFNFKGTGNFFRK